MVGILQSGEKPGISSETDRWLLIQTIPVSTGAIVQHCKAPYPAVLLLAGAHADIGQNCLTGLWHKINARSTALHLQRNRSFEGRHSSGNSGNVEIC